MKTKDEFEKFCDETISKVLEPYYSKNKKQIISTACMYVAIEIVVIIAINFIKSKVNLGFSYGGIFAVISVILSIAALSMLFKKIKNNMVSINKFVIENIMEFITDSKKILELKENTRISTDTLNECRIFNLKDLKVTGKNYMTFWYKGKNITVSDTQIYKYVKKDKKYVKKYIFDGQFISMNFNKPVRSFIYLVPNNLKDFGNKLLNYINYEGTRVDLENPLFSKKYKVYSYDEIQARYILSLRLMERITELDLAFKDKKYIVFRENGKITLFIENETMDNVKNVKLPIMKNLLKEQKCLLNIFKKLVRFTEIYEILDLDNKLYEPDKMVQQLLNDAKKNDKSKKEVISTSVVPIKERITTGTLSGIVENKRFGYKYRYENCVKLNNDKSLTLPYDVTNTVTFITPDLENKNTNLIENKINIMVNEFGWEIKEPPVTIVSAGNKFVKVVYKGENANSRNMTTYYYCNPDSDSYTCGINFKYYENDISYVESQVATILSSFILQSRIGGYMTYEDKGFEYQYKNALEKKDDKIYFNDGIYITTVTRVNRENYTLPQFVESLKNNFIQELKWQNVEEIGEFEYGNNKFYKLLVTDDKNKMETFIYTNEYIPEVWYRITFRSKLDVSISNISDELDFVLSSFKILNTKKKGTCISSKYGIKYDYINANKIDNDRNIIFSKNREVYIKLKNLRTFASEEECIKNAIAEYTEWNSWVLKSGIEEVTCGEKVYRKTFLSSTKTLGYNMDLYFRYVPETNYMLIVPTYYYNDEIAEITKEVDTILASLEMLNLKSGREMINNSGISIEYINAIGFAKNKVYYSTNTIISMDIYNLERYKDEKDVYEISNNGLLKNNWEITNEQDVLVGNTRAHMFELRAKERKDKARTYFIKSQDGRQIYDVTIEYYDNEDQEYSKELLTIINSIKLESGEDGTLESLKNSCGFKYKNAFYDKKENKIVYHGNTTFSIVTNKINNEENEEDFINNKIREMTSELEWEFLSSGQEEYGNNKYLKYAFKGRNERILEKYILLPMKNDRNTVFQINIIYTKDNINMLLEEKKYALSSFCVYEKIEGNYTDEKHNFSYNYINANYMKRVDENDSDTNTLYYPNSFNMKVLWGAKSKYATLEDFMKFKENQWVDEWKFTLISGPEEFAIGENEFVKYKIKSQKTTLSREIYFYKNNKKQYYNYVIFEYYDNDVNNYLNELMYILLTFKEV